MCEDVRTLQWVLAFATGLVNELNAWNGEPGPDLTSSTSSFQWRCSFVYPFVTVIEKHHCRGETVRPSVDTVAPFA